MPRLATIRRFVSSTGARIYRIPCEVLPQVSGRVYLVLGAGPATLVDAGSGEGGSTEQIVAGLEEIAREFGEDFSPGQIERILITHAHVDHIGGLAHMVALTGGRVGVHALDCRVVAAWDERAVVFNRGLEAFLQRAGVAPDAQAGLIEAFGFAPGRVRGVKVDFFLEDAQEIDALRVIHTPGHSPGHVCILAGDVLLCGDHILARTIPQQWPESLAAYTGRGNYLDSLGKVAALEGVGVALGGHEPPVIRVTARIEEIRAAQERRFSRVLDILAGSAHPLSMAEITRQMYSRQKGFYELLALTDVGARVEYLEQRGHLEVANLDEIQRDGCGAWRYRPAPSVSMRI